MKQRTVIILTKEEFEAVKKIYAMAEDLYLMKGSIFADEEEAMTDLCNFFENYAFNKDVTKCEINGCGIIVEEK